MHWKYETDTDVDTTKFEVWTYGHYGTKTFSNVVGKILNIFTANTNCAHYILY